MLKHFPDKPWQRKPNELASWDDGDYVCQQKCDGWRVQVIKSLDGAIHYYSRHDKSLTDDIEASLKQEMAAMLANAPHGSQLDGEWLSRRSHSKLPGAQPHLVMFDVVRWDRRWLLRKPYQERLQLLQEVVVPADNISLPETAEPGSFVSFYEQQKSIPQSEGVVVKLLRSTLIGDRNESKKNPHWFKIKYRGGRTGEERLD